MLVLSRQRDETIMIVDDIEVTVVDIRGDKVRLGITAPKEIGVHRKEIYDAIKRDAAKAEYAAGRHAKMVARAKPVGSMPGDVRPGETAGAVLP